MSGSHTILRGGWLGVLGLALSTLGPGAGTCGEVVAVMTAPARLYAGSRSALTVSTLDAATRSPVDAPVSVDLVGSDESASVRIVSASTGPTGHLRAEFDVPQLPSGGYRLRALIGGARAPLEADTAIARTPAILIETDKPIYKPSQTIQGRVLLLDNALRPTAGEVELTFHDAKGIRIDRRRLATDEYGAAAFSLELAKEVNFGTWKVRATSEGAESARDIRVEEYTLPRFELRTVLPREWALVDEPIAGRVEARYFFGKDVEGTATVRATRWVGVWEEYAAVEGVLSSGVLEFTLPPVGFVSGTPGASGLGTITLEVGVTDSTGHEQSATEVVTIAEAPIVVSLISRARTLKPGIPAEILVSTKTPGSVPIDIEVSTTTVFYAATGDRLAESAEVVRTVGGVGTLELVPPANTGFAEVKGTATLDGRATSASVRVDGSWSPSSSFLSLARIDGDGPVPVGRTIDLSAVSTHPGTLYYEVYAGGRTVVSDVSEPGRFSVAVTTDMVPRARIVAYKIDPDNEVAADSLEVEVQLPISVTLRASFGSETVAPGDPVDVTIDSGTGRKSLLGVSAVDRSVLALGQSRLHLADVFAELERRFLEPQAEVHEGGGEEPDVGPPGRFWEDVPSTKGASDILGDVGLVIVASEGISIPRGGEMDWWRWADAEDGGNLPPVAGGDEFGEPSSTPVRVRQYFPETWVWEPLLLTDDAGLATLRLAAPDSITGWKLSVVGTTPGAAPGEAIGFGEDDLTVFQDFFVEPSLPFAVVRGEVFPVKVDVFNYLEEAQSVRLELEGSEGFELLGASRIDVSVPAGLATAVQFPIRPTGIGEFPLRLLATGSKLSDAVLRPIRVVPEGVPAEDVRNGVIEAGATVPLDVTIPAAAVAGSGRAYLHVTPSPVAQTMNGVSDLLGMPYGCGEQNMIFLAPDIEILKYLRETGELSPEVRVTAEHYVNVGYQRQLTFRCDDGGFAAFGGAEGSLWLTAFVVSTFAGGREVRDIDETMLGSAASMLVSRQDADGSFRTDDFLIHKEMDGGMENIFAMASFVTNALADYVQLAPAGFEPPAAVPAAIQKAAEFLARSRSTLPGVNDDPYGLSIAAVALGKVPGQETAAAAILDRLLELASSDGPGIHWEPYPVETTGYAAMALLGANGGAGRPEAAAAVEWLSAQRNSMGGYGQSTQDTVVAIRALFLAARKVHADLDVTLSVRRGEEALFQVRIDASNYDLFHAFELPVDGGLALSLESSGRGNVGFQVVRRYNLPGDLLPPPRDMLFDVTYDAAHVEVDDLVDVTVTLRYTGTKASTGMVIADVGVPTGFAVSQPSLDALVASGASSRIETAGRKVIFYIEALRRDEPLALRFQVRALYPVRAEGPVSHAYEYYDPDVEAWDGHEGFVIEEPEARTFVRGDTLGDGHPDISDCILTLNWLFLGGERPGCVDAADSNDDGAVNITDPIFQLGFLFLGGREPPPPYPEAGTDPTPDGLGC